jgi:hypothetical protein
MPANDRRLFLAQIEIGDPEFLERLKAADALGHRLTFVVTGDAYGLTVTAFASGGVRLAEPCPCCNTMVSGWEVACPECCLQLGAESPRSTEAIRSLVAGSPNDAASQLRGWYGPAARAVALRCAKAECREGGGEFFWGQVAGVLLCPNNTIAPGAQGGVHHQEGP